MKNFFSIATIIVMSLVLMMACGTDDKPEDMNTTEELQDIGLTAKVKVTWDNGQQSKEFELGDYTAENGDFPNDVIEEIHVPFGVTVLAFEDYSFEGDTQPMVGSDPTGLSVFSMKERGLDGKVSGLRITKGL